MRSPRSLSPCSTWRWLGDPSGQRAVRAVAVVGHAARRPVDPAAAYRPSVRSVFSEELEALRAPDTRAIVDQRLERVVEAARRTPFWGPQLAGVPTREVLSTVLPLSRQSVVDNIDGMLDRTIDVQPLSGALAVDRTGASSECGWRRMPPSVTGRM